MARTDYGPEVKASMQHPAKKQPPKPPQRAAQKEPGPGDTPADMARDKQRGIVEGSPQDEAIDARLAQGSPSAHSMPHPPAQGGGNAAHAAMAASIAHSILQSGSKGGY